LNRLKQLKKLLRRLLNLEDSDKLVVELFSRNRIAEIAVVHVAGRGSAWLRSDIVGSAPMILACENYLLAKTRTEARKTREEIEEGIEVGQY